MAVRSVLRFRRVRRRRSAHLHAALRNSVATSARPRATRCLARGFRGARSAKRRGVPPRTVEDGAAMVANSATRPLRPLHPLRPLRRRRRVRRRRSAHLHAALRNSVATSARPRATRCLARGFRGARSAKRRGVPPRTVEDGAAMVANSATSPLRPLRPLRRRRRRVFPFAKDARSSGGASAGGLAARAATHAKTRHLLRRRVFRTARLTRHRGRASAVGRGAVVVRTADSVRSGAGCDR